MKDRPKKRILVYGAGAIGRGYLPWVFDPWLYEYYFVEKELSLRRALNASGQFTTYKTLSDGYAAKTVRMIYCFDVGEEDEIARTADVVATAVGPRNVMALVEQFRHVHAPIICCENDSSIPERMNSLTGKDNFLFAIPDVITSNTAPPSLLEHDPLSIVTEDGICFIDDKAEYLSADCAYVAKAELRKQWLAKLYIHNTPHCIAAYFGALLGVTYLHEALQRSLVEEVVQGVMDEMGNMLEQRHRLDHSFVRWYSAKEMQRFKNLLLFDPVSRVAREPFRKLALNDRLIGAAQLCLSAGIIPHHIILGIMAAFSYENSNDPDYNIKYLINALSPFDFLRIIIGLNPDEALFCLIQDAWDKNISLLKGLKRGF